LLTCEVVSARQLSQFIGKLNAASQAIQVAPLFYRALQANLQEALVLGNQDYNQRLPLSSEAREELELVGASPDPLEWENHSSEVNTNGDSVRCFPPDGERCVKG